MKHPAPTGGIIYTNAVIYKTAITAERDAVVACMGLHIYENPKPALGMILTNESMARQDAAWAAKRDAALDALIEKAMALGAGPLVAALEDQHTFLCYITETNTAARNDEELLVAMGDKLRAALAATGKEDA